MLIPKESEIFYFFMIKEVDECKPCAQAGSRLECRAIVDICGQSTPFYETCDSSDSNCTATSLLEKIDRQIILANADRCGDCQ